MIYRKAAEEIFVLSRGVPGDIRSYPSHQCPRCSLFLDTRIKRIRRICQWNSVTTPYQTQGLGVEMKFATNEYSDNYLALGVQMTNDIAGDSKLGKTQILPVLTYHYSLSDDNDTYLSAGFMVGAVQQRV